MGKNGNGLGRRVETLEKRADRNERVMLKILQAIRLQGEENRRLWIEVRRHGDLLEKHEKRLEEQGERLKEQGERLKEQGERLDVVVRLFRHKSEQ